MSEILMNQDRKFSRETSMNGVDGWVSHFAFDGMMLTKNGSNIIGHAEIRRAMEGFFELENLKFVWEPEKGRLAKSEDLGYTYGAYTREYTNDSGEDTIESGRYITIWELQEDGSYKVTVDLGN